MSTVHLSIPPQPSPEPVFRLSVEQYHTMIRTGVLTDDDPVELLEGILVFKMPKNPPHETALGKCQDELPRILPKTWILRVQAPITLRDGEPEPDLVIARGSRDNYAEHHPGPSDIGLVIEVADTTLARDQGIKLRSYARAGLGAYWIINLIDRHIEVYSDPDIGRFEPAYQSKTIFSPADSIPVSLDGQTQGLLAVAQLLP